MEKESWSKGEYYAYARNLFDPEKIWEKPEALQGLLVLEFATFMNGPLVANLLGDMGAEVIKFELPLGAREDMPTGGDPVRFVGPPGTAIQGANLQTFVVNRNKHHVTLDIAHPKGKEIFRKFALQADVIVENLRAGTMDRMGSGVPAAEPRESPPDLPGYQWTWPMGSFGRHGLLRYPGSSHERLYLLDRLS